MGDPMDFIKTYLAQISGIAGKMDCGSVGKMVSGLRILRGRGGRLFMLGVGGSASNGSHAVNDFRKICDIETYAPTDNVSELTARINDEGWESSLAAWLRASRLNEKDGIFILSVGGGNPEKNISMNLVAAMKYAKEVGASIFGIVGRDGGFTRTIGDHVVLVPTVSPERVTFHAETFQSVILHLIAAHPDLKAAPTKWEELQR